LKRLLKILATLILFVAGLTIIRLQPKRVAYGHYAGECVGNCGTIYEVTNKFINIDTTSFWQTQDDLSKLQIQRQRFLEKNDEIDLDIKRISVPLIMLLDPRTIFGCPDCHDQGGYYLDFTMFGVRRHYQIDKESEPFYFPSLTKDIDKRIEAVNHELTKYGR
jgi:hypothetical protein